MLEDKLISLSQMMAEHMARPFPPSLRGRNIEGQDMVSLDADTYGYASGVLKGPLDARRRAGLTALPAVFEAVLPAIYDAYASEYFTHVRDLAVLTAEIETLRDRQRSGAATIQSTARHL
ncbi:hypothetical protein [Streptomyces anandii]|uniref:hypothetical protein n=1 Tax=Streptomyces anandii TaxID=285454 RepID=UPI00167B6DC7|nr:hypothetical protein [Streptomyces anandii]